LATSLNFVRNLEMCKKPVQKAREFRDDDAWLLKL